MIMVYGSRNLKAHLERRIYGDIENDPAARAKMELTPHPFITGLTYGESDLVKDDVNKVCFLESDMPFEQISQRFMGKFEVIRCTVPLFGEGSGELMIPGIHKAVAIADLLEHLQLKQEDSLAIGDGMNDAMGNARPGLKQIADDITGTVEEDGLYHSFIKYGLISA